MRVVGIAMAMVFLALYLCFASLGPKETTVVGVWVYLKGPTDFDSMEFALEGTEHIFRSWMHNRPAPLATGSSMAIN